LIAIEGGIGQFISNLDPWINLPATVKSAAAMRIANIACPLAIAGEYWGDCDGVADGIE
jgi:hypothetical protein